MTDAAPNAGQDRVTDSAAPCVICGQPLSDARAALGLTVCSGKCARERWQPKGREMTMELTEALIRDGNTVLVRMQRDWTGDERWSIEPDRARPASGYVKGRIVDGWEEARQTAAEMAKDVMRHAEALQAANFALTELWPRWEPTDAD